MPVGRWVMRMAEFGLVDVLAAGALRADGVDAQVRVVDIDVDVLGLGQHRDGGGRGMDAALASVAGTRWTRWTPLSNFSRAKTPRPVIAAMISL